MTYGKKNWAVNDLHIDKLDPSRLQPYQRAIVGQIMAESERLKALATHADKFARLTASEQWRLNSPASLYCRGRYKDDSYEQKPFVGDEVFRITSAYYEKGKVWIAAQPAVPDPKIAWVRFEFHRARELLIGYAAAFDEWLNDRDDQSMAETVRDSHILEIEAARVELGGGNPEFGTW